MSDSKISNPISESRTDNPAPLTDADLARIAKLADGAVKAEHDDLGGLAQAIYDLLDDLRRAKEEAVHLGDLRFLYDGLKAERDELRADAISALMKNHDCVYEITEAEPYGACPTCRALAAWRASRGEVSDE
jgi:hypothetical protein